MINIPRIKGLRVFLSVLRNDEEAIKRYMCWMSNEATCVNIEMSDKVVDITQMPGWVADHSVMRMGICIAAPNETEDDGDGTKMIGYCHVDHRASADAAWLSINIGDESARGQGFGKEVVSLLRDFCFEELGVESVHMDVLEINTSAIRCYEAVGFQISGRYRKHCIHKGKHIDWLHMDMTREDWDNRIEANL